MKKILPQFTSLAVALATFVSLSLIQAEEVPQRTSTVVLSRDLPKKIAESHHDVCRATAACGIDYPVLVQQALDGEQRAFRLMLYLPWIARFDGAVATSYAATRHQTILLIGDEKLVAACLPWREGIDFTKVRESFLGFPNSGENIEEAMEEMRKKLPKFWKLLSDKIEQAKPPLVIRAEMSRKQLLQIREGDFLEWASSFDFDVVEVIEGCLDDVNERRQLNSWKRLVHFLHKHGADGSAGEELSSIGPSLAAQLDDDRLLGIIAKIPESQWLDLPFALRWRFQYERLPVADQEKLRKLHPIAVKAIEREMGK